MDLGNFIIVDGRLTRATEVDLVEVEWARDLLTPHEVLKQVLTQAKGERIVL